MTALQLPELQRGKRALGAFRPLPLPLPSRNSAPSAKVDRKYIEVPVLLQPRRRAGLPKGTLPFPGVMAPGHRSIWQPSSAQRSSTHSAPAQQAKWRSEGYEATESRPVCPVLRQVVSAGVLVEIGCSQTCPFRIGQ
jgi:hypothetical protein